jgi:glycosidase
VSSPLPLRDPAQQPSPFRDDGYDIADYYSIHPSYGTLDDFGAFLDAAHARRLRVVTELMLNHTADQHAGFKEARRSRWVLTRSSGSSSDLSSAG